jgi:oxaloacetate decarboxylase alpha subunit
MTAPAAARSVRLVDTSIRDGNQSLWGAAGLTTGMVEALGPRLEAAGFKALDFTSSTHLSVGVRWHKENPWERISRMRAVTPTTPLSLITTGMRFMSWDRSPRSAMELSMRILAESGLRRIQVLEPMNDVAAASVVARMAKDAGFEQVVAAVTFTESPVHDDALYAAAAKALAQDENVDVVYLKDPGGLLTPDRVRHLVPQMMAAVGDTPLELHSHCTTGLAPEVYVVAAQLGVETLHTAIGALSNGTSQPSATRLVENLAAVGISTDIDVEPLREAERIIDVIATSQSLEPGRPTELDLAYQKHQIPGGMMGTLRRQLSEIGKLDLLPAVLEEVSQVRAALGYPIMVTPYSQFVGSQAVMNVMAEQAGGTRWERMPDEVLRYLLGHFGTPPGPIDPEVAQRAADSPRTRELDKALPEPSLEELRSSVAAQLGAAGRVASPVAGPPDDGEVLLRTVLPADQVDAMLAAGPAPAWDPDKASHPSLPEVSTAADFICAVDALPHWRELEVWIGEEKVRLSRPSGPEDREMA